MTPEQARRRAATRIRRRRRRILVRALLFVPALLGIVALFGEFVAVSQEPTEPTSPRRALRALGKGTEPSRLPVPVPVFRPSVVPSVLELEISDIGPLDLDLRNRKVERFLEKRRLALAEKEEDASTEPEPAVEPEVRVMTRNLMQVPAVKSHLLEIIRPRPYLDPPEDPGLVMPEYEIGWPWTFFDLPVLPGFGLFFVEEWPNAKSSSEEEEEEEPQPPPVPEPSTAILVALGLVVLGVGCRRRSGGCLRRDRST
jgi:hypothetical protein